MHRFQIIAHTQKGESIGLVGSTLELGQWDISRSVRLQTSPDRYPLWWADIEINGDSALGSADSASREAKLEYKYVRLKAEGSQQWEALGSNRWIPLTAESIGPLIVDDGTFGQVQPWPYGYLVEPAVKMPLPKAAQGLKILVIGSSVALGCNAWLLKGWAWHLEQALHHQYGHQLVNVSTIGANVSTTIERFAQVVTPEQPDVVIVALSLGNEGLAYCAPSQRRAVQRRFESGLQRLLKMIRDLGALPMLGGLYPHGDYNSDHYGLLQETHHRMLSWGVPVLNWLAAVDDGQGRWQAGTFFNPAHPNTTGHRLMYEAIDLQLFEINKADQMQAAQVAQQQKDDVPIYQGTAGFQVFADSTEQTLRVVNGSTYAYTIAPDWEDLQTALQGKAGLTRGLYLAETATVGTLPYFAVRADGTIETMLDIPPAADLRYRAAAMLFAPNSAQILFYDGHLGLLKETDHCLRVINESDHDYNLQPMWQEVRSALKALPSGVYEDPDHPHAPFRTLMIGNQGLESRVKAPPKSAMRLQYKCPLSDISRVAIIPLGDRCAIRMLLYKLEYDGPAFPFDLTRSTNLGDVADMIETRFEGMWQPDRLHYNPDEYRIYHTKWTGLSFAHEVEETDDPIHDMSPVYERMRSRYTARAERFWYTIDHCDKLLFVRTGVAARGQVSDLVSKLEAKCQGKPFRVLMISPQSSDEFADLANVLHYNLEFNPDRMYEDLGYWLHCTEVMREILTSLGVSSQNLFWCPPKPPTEVARP